MKFDKKSPIIPKGNATPLRRCMELTREINSTTLSTLDETHLKNSVEELTYSLFNFPISCYEGFTLYRGRYCERYKLFKNISELSHRKSPDSSSNGRVHSGGNVVFYGSDTHETVFSELRLKDSDCLNIITCKIKKGKECLFLPIGNIDSYRRYKRTYLNLSAFGDAIRDGLASLDDDTAQAVRLVDAFFADRFSRIGKSEYKITNLIASEFLSDQMIDGVMYPSVVHPGTYNYAIKPESFSEKFDIIHAQGQAILRAYGYGIYHNLFYANSVELKEDGTINWEHLDVPENLDNFIEQKF